MSKQETKKNNKLVKIIFYIIIICGLLVSLPFGKQLELAFKLKPNTDGLYEEKDFQIHFIDVGQGDAMAIRFANGETMLVDSGPVKGESNLKSYLNNVFFKNGDREFDYVLLSHSDADHSGNMAFVLNNYAVKKFYRPYIFNTSEKSNEGLSLPTSAISLYTEVINILKSKHIETEFFKAGDTINIGTDVTIDFYAPVDLTVDDTNSFSPIMVLNNNGKSVCLTGDAPIEEEQDALEAYDLPDVDLLKLGHHGSKGSTSKEFLDKIQPEYVVAQVGKNSYGHPTNEVLNRLADYDAEYNKSTYTGFLCNLKNGNIIYHVQPGEDFEVKLIASMSSFIFMDWFVVVIIVAGAVTIVFFVPKTKKYSKRRKKKRANN